MDLDSVSYTVVCGDIDPHTVIQTAHDIASAVAPNYIWYRDPFSLAVVSQSGSVAGTTAFGPAIDDEWLVVYILHRLTLDLAVSAHVSDSDGEFLLIEAAHVLPAWLEPETAEGRLWIKNGEFQLIPRGQFGGNAVAVEQAAKYVSTGRRMDLDRATNEAIQKRVARVPRAVAHNTHRALVTIPLKLARLVYSHPELLSPAVDGLFQDQNHGMGEGGKTSHFPLQDMVTVSVGFTRLLYAEAMQIASRGDSKEDKPEDVLGRKLTVAFERLFSVGDDQWSPKELAGLAVGEVEFSTETDSDAWLQVMKEDLDEDEEDFDEDGMKDTIAEVMSRLNEFMGKEEGLFKDEEGDEEEEEDEEDKEAKSSKPGEVRDEDVVNEDEFFEFFLKDALKLKDEDVAEFLARDRDETKEELQEAGIVGDETEEEMLQNLMQSLNSMGGLQGPAATFLSQMGINPSVVRDKGGASTAASTAASTSTSTSTTEKPPLSRGIGKMTDDEILENPSVLDSSEAAIERTFAPPADDEEDFDYENDNDQDGKLHELHDRIVKSGRKG